MSKKSLLIIMDGWGHGQVPEADAIQQARVPYIRSLYTQYPNTELITCGEAVGLPEGQMGNSEVGHLNIGAGRIVYQELQRITRALRDGSFSTNMVWRQLINTVKSGTGALHLMGLVSDGGVHAHIEHLKSICRLIQEENLPQVFLHVFTDGRDTDPKSGAGFIQELQWAIQDTPVRMASITGRYYAMDRDKRWERIRVAYNALVHAQGLPAHDPVQAMEEAYAAGETDEFIQPRILVDAQGQPIATIKAGDSVFCFNFRTDRCREITEALTQKDFPEQSMQCLDVHYTTMTEYDKQFKNVACIFKQDDLKNTLGEVLASQGKTQIRIAETEKYPHVTFFFSGGREQPFPGERRLLCPSPQDVPTYDLKPEMSALEITDAILPEIDRGETDFICLNFANADMVGHTGVWDAVIKAVETVNSCVEILVPRALQAGYTIFLTADHGNSDFMINADGTPNTAHTLNPVPLIVIDQETDFRLKPGKLADLAPSILYRMGLPIPEEMSGDILFCPPQAC